MHLVAGDRACIVPETIVAGAVPNHDEVIPVKFDTIQEAEKTEMQFREWKRRSVSTTESGRRTKPRVIRPEHPLHGWTTMKEYYEKIIENCDEKIETSTPDISRAYTMKKALSLIHI